MNQVNSKVDDIEKARDAVRVPEGTWRETGSRCMGDAGTCRPSSSGDGTLTNRRTRPSQDVIRELIDAEESFVPGRRRGYAIIPFFPERGEAQEDARRRALRAVQKVRTAKTGGPSGLSTSKPNQLSGTAMCRRTPTGRTSSSSISQGSSPKPNPRRKQGVVASLRRACKSTPWRPFRSGEL